MAIQLFQVLSAKMQMGQFEDPETGDTIWYRKGVKIELEKGYSVFYHFEKKPNPKRKKTPGAQPARVTVHEPDGGLRTFDGSIFLRTDKDGEPTVNKGRTQTLSEKAFEREYPKGLCLAVYRAVCDVEDEATARFLGARA
jgi:hypothetical protein